MKNILYNDDNIDDVFVDENYKNMEKLHRYIEKLSKPELMSLLKWELENRLFLEERLRILEAKLNE